jgi:beta-mannosidase
MGLPYRAISAMLLRSWRFTLYAAGVELSGEWRACVADDDVRRDGVGLDHDDRSWSVAAVPGHWRSNPAFAQNDGPLLYRTRFHLDVPPDGRRRFVTLEGVFYQADVWLDGAYLGDPEGYFFPHSFDITDLSRLGHEHVLAIEVACSPQLHRTAKRNITGSLQHSDMLDPNWNPGGLWRPVRIDDTGNVRIDRVRVLCRDANDARAHLRLHARLDADAQRSVVLRTSVDGEVLAEQSRSLAKGLNEVDWDLDVNDPALWWPWSLGEQHLTEVHVEILVDGDTSDERTVRTGLREVALHDWVFSVNGEPLFVKGVNVAPTRQALAEASASEVRRDVELARDAGLDLIRVNGHIARPELYEAADELGMLVWQDFPLQWGYARTIRKEAVRQAREAVDQLGHHPSIAVWCAHNEPLPVDEGRQKVFGASIVRHVLKEQMPTWNKTILDRWVKRAFETADETRAVVAHSGVAPHVPQLNGTDSHLFFGWYHGDERDLDGFAASLPRMMRFVSEFGAQSVPEAADFMDPAKWPALDWDRLVAEHGMQRDAFETHVPPHRYPTFEAWRDATQRYQADLLRHHIESLRRLKYRPTGGFCFLALNDAHPAISWSVLDHERHPKQAYGAVLDACRPVIVVAERPPSEVVAGETIALDVHVVSDVRRVLEATVCTANLRWVGGDHRWQWTGDVPPDDCVRVGTVQFVVPDTTGEMWLDLTLEHGDVVVTNRYTTVIAARP